MAPISSTCACRHVSWRKRGAKHRITAAKQAGRRSMVAVLWPGRASLADHPLRRPTLQVRTALTPCRTGQSRAQESVVYPLVRQSCGAWLEERKGEGQNLQIWV